MGLDLKELRLVPGVDAEMTPSLAQAVVIDSANIRWKEGLPEKLGGWGRYYPNSVGAIPRFIWGWQDFSITNHLAVGAAPFLEVITGGAITDITPQTTTTNTAPDFSTVQGSTTVTINDPNITNPTTNNSVYIKTPVAIGGIVLYGLYQIITILGANKYTILAGLPATSTVNNAGTLMTFQTTNASAIVSMVLPNHGLGVGSQLNIQVPITLGGLTISGNYLVPGPPGSVTSSNFTIVAASLATSNAGPTTQNGGLVQFVYYIAIGPTQANSGWGVGPWGAGGWGTGQALPSGSGTPITAVDWTGFNWGEILITCPAGQAIYQWGPESTLQNAQIISAAPIVADGICLAQPEQILIAWGVAAGQNNQTGSIGTIANIGVLNPLRMVWSDAGNFSNFTAASNTLAGGFNLSSGSRIVSVVQGANQFAVFTDIGVWSGTFVSVPLVFSIVEVMKGCGLIGRHAAGVLGTSFYWMGQNQFFTMAAGGVPQPIKCTIWDDVFQNINRAFFKNVVFYSNAAFNEIGWFYPSAASLTGECDMLAKYDVMAGIWDINPIGRSAWMDQSVLGQPIGTSNGTNSVGIGFIYQHETSPDADGAALNWFIQTGDFVIGTGDEFQLIDYWVPDMRYGYKGSPQTAQAQITFFMKGFPSDGQPGNNPVVTQGPYTFTQATNFIEPRMRGRLFSMRIEGLDVGSFVRLGLMRYRSCPDGRNP